MFRLETVVRGRLSALRGGLQTTNHLGVIAKSAKRVKPPTEICRGRGYLPQASHAARVYAAWGARSLVRTPSSAPWCPGPRATGR